MPFRVSGLRDKFLPRLPESLETCSRCLLLDFSRSRPELLRRFWGLSGRISRITLGDRRVLLFLANILSFDLDPALRVPRTSDVRFAEAIVRPSVRRDRLDWATVVRRPKFRLSILGSGRITCCLE